MKVKDENHEKTLNLALNRIHGEFDEDLLNEVLLELEEVNLDHLTGFDLDLDDIDYDFISRMDEYDDEEEIEEYENEIIEDVLDEEEYIEEEPIEKINPTEKKEKKERIRRGFIKYGDIYKIGDSSYLMFGQDSNEQDRTKLLNANIQKTIPVMPKEIKKIKTVTQKIDYYMSNDAELIENIIIENNKICKKIT